MITAIRNNRLKHTRYEGILKLKSLLIGSVVYELNGRYN